MQLLTTIFRYEWRQFLRRRVMLYSLLFFIGTGIAAIQTGNKAVQQQRSQLDSLQVAYQRDYQLMLQKVTDTATEEGRKKAANDALAEVINFRLPQNALKYPSTLQALSTGISDIQPYYQQVQTAVNYLNPPNTPVSNPVKLLAGNFDWAFVLMYILPLLISAFCYPLYAEEKEAGTAALLSVQGQSLHRIIQYKWLFRMLLISAVVALINTAACISMPANTTLFGREQWLWGWIVQAYILCWFAAGYAVVSLKQNSAITALLLTALWVMTVMVWPAITNIYLAARYPVPLRSEMASYQRHEGEEIWSMKPKDLADTFNLYHPQYAASIDPAKDTLHLSQRYIAGYHFLIEKRVGAEAAKLEQQLQQRNSYFARLAAGNPVLNTQQWLNELAGTTMGHYQEYRRQTAVYQRQWKAFLYPWQLSSKGLPIDQLRHLPVFTYQPPTVSTAGIIAGNWLLYVLTGLLWQAGNILFQRQKRS